MSRAPRRFDLGAVLSVTGDKLLCPVADVYEILNFLTADKLFTHQLPRACDHCRPWLLQQHPALAEIDGAKVTPENWRGHLAAARTTLGATQLLIEPLPAGVWVHVDPIQEAKEMVGQDRVIVVKPS